MAISNLDNSTNLENTVVQSRTIKIIDGSFTQKQMNEIFDAYLDLYKEKICNGSRLTEGGKKKLLARLKTYTRAELIESIENFSKDEWYMKNCANKGIQWFFWSDDRIDQFLNLKKPEVYERPLNLK